MKELAVRDGRVNDKEENANMTTATAYRCSPESGRTAGGS